MRRILPCHSSWSSQPDCSFARLRRSTDCPSASRRRYVPIAQRKPAELWGTVLLTINAAPEARAIVQRDAAAALTRADRQGAGDGGRRLNRRTMERFPDRPPHLLPRPAGPTGPSYFLMMRVARNLDPLAAAARTWVTDPPPGR